MSIINQARTRSDTRPETCWVRGGGVTTAGLSKDSVANVSQIVTLDKRQLAGRAGAVDHDTLAQIEAGLRPVLDLVA